MGPEPRGVADMLPSFRPPRGRGDGLWPVGRTESYVWNDSGLGFLVRVLLCHRLCGRFLEKGNLTLVT